MSGEREFPVDPDFIARLRQDMFKFANLQLRDQSAAEDAVQEALAAAFAGAREFSARSALKTWVFAILRHKIADHIRQQSRTTNISAFSPEEQGLDQAFETLFKSNAHWQPESRPADWGNPEQALEQQRFWEVFDACPEHLPENTARVFMMREFLEFDTGEVCEALNISLSNCNVILHRARNRLRQCLGKNWFSRGEN